MASSVPADTKPQESIKSLVERSSLAIDHIEKTHKKIEEIRSKKPRPENIDQQLVPLRAALREATGEINKLIGEFKVGRSIFSYPGLIDLGRTRVISPKDLQKVLRETYCLKFLIGYNETSSGVLEPQFYEVHFDADGLIISHHIIPSHECPVISN